MKHTIREIFRSPKFVTGFVILMALLLTVILYPLLVTADPLEIIAKGTFFEPGVYVNVYDSVGSKTYTLNLSDAQQRRIDSRLGEQERRYRAHWVNLRIDPPVRKGAGAFRVGDTFEVNATVHLGELTPGEVDVQLYYGKLKSVDRVSAGSIIPMTLVKDLGGGSYAYRCDFTCDKAGRHGFTVRAIPNGDDYIKNLPGLITWAQ